MEKAAEKKLSERFEIAFNRIHKRLKQAVTDVSSDRFSLLVRKGAKKYSAVRKYEEELHQFAKLRNAIVHEKVNLDYYIAEPHLEVVERVEEIAERFEQPQTALSIATKPAFYYYENAYLKDVLKVINKFSYTQFPIYGEDHQFKWLLTSAGIIKWMSGRLTENVINFEEVTVSDLYTSENHQLVDFASKSASIFEVEEMFEKYYLENKKLQAVIITEEGTSKETPLGIVTAWDLLEIDTQEN